jgi:hypothetical protein
MNRKWPWPVWRYAGIFLQKMTKTTQSTQHSPSCGRQSDPEPQAECYRLVRDIHGRKLGCLLHLVAACTAESKTSQTRHNVQPTGLMRSALAMRYALRLCLFRHSAPSLSSASSRCAKLALKNCHKKETRWLLLNTAPSLYRHARLYELGTVSYERTTEWAN